MHARLWLTAATRQTCLTPWKEKPPIWHEQFGTSSPLVVLVVLVPMLHVTFPAAGIPEYPHTTRCLSSLLLAKVPRQPRVTHIDVGDSHPNETLGVQSARLWRFNRSGASLHSI